MKSVPFLSPQEIRDCTPYPELIRALDEMFRSATTAPPREHYAIPQTEGRDATMLIMPAWRSPGALGVKVVNVFPENGRAGLPAVQGVYLLFNSTTGQLIALVDGAELTARRTAAASALASQYISRRDTRVMLMAGTGRLARELIRAHRCVRDIDVVLVWGRNRERAQQVVDELQEDGLTIKVTEDLSAAAAQADLISTATLSSEPLIRGQWLQPGCHLDLVGAYRPDMRESDDEVMKRATAIYVDTRAGALAEGGDLIQPLAHHIFSRSKIVADLSELSRGFEVNRQPQQVTVFKSVGASVEDLAAAELCWKKIAT